jgi:3-dehydroquinate synthase
MKLLIRTPPLSFSTEVYIGEGLAEQNLLSDLCAKKRAALIADERLIDCYGQRLSQKLRSALFSIPSGELCKTRNVKERIEDGLLQAGYGRDSVLIALGGGSATDLVGLIASTYLRGISLILIPTTLLAMVDASIGGKTAINTDHGKNLIGAFYPAQAVICDLQMLSTLPRSEWIYGLAEILKIALVFDASLWEMAQRKEPLALIERAIAKKIEIIEQDFYEKNLRYVLNFGHTIGHALEAASNYTMAHGQAVLLGSVAESYLSQLLGHLKPEAFETIHAFYKKLLLSQPWPKQRREKISQALFFDKKKEAGATRFVLLEQIGRAFSIRGDYCHAVDRAALEETLVWMEKNYG